MLLYHFGSRDGILDAIVAETSRRLATSAVTMDASLPEIVRSSWSWMTAPSQRGFLNVFYEVCALGGARSDAPRGRRLLPVYGLACVIGRTRYS